MPTQDEIEDIEPTDVSSLGSLQPQQVGNVARLRRTYGLTQVYPDPMDKCGSKRAKIDIIVLHGLSADSRSTWDAWEDETDPGSRHVNWLKDPNMLPMVVPDARILTYDWNANYDEDASNDIFIGHADTLLNRIYINRHETDRLQRPIIFIASCFGGLLLMQALLRATDPYTPRREQNAQILGSTVGLVFLGTPFQGSWGTGYTAAKLRLLVALLSGHKYSPRLVEYLQGGCGNRSLLDELGQRFSEMIRLKSLNFKIVCFYETKATNYGAMLKKLPSNWEQDKFVKSLIDPNGWGVIVERHSACLPGEDAVGLDVRHNMLHKHSNPEDDSFKQLASRIKEFANYADEIRLVNEE